MSIFPGVDFEIVGEAGACTADHAPPATPRGQRSAQTADARTFKRMWLGKRTGLTYAGSDASFLRIYWEKQETYPYHSTE